MDSKEIIFTDEFKEYRERQVEEIAIMLGAELNTTVNSDRLNGLLDMAKRIIKLPSILIKDEKQDLKLNKLLTEDLTDLTIKIVREKLTRKETP